MAHSGHRSFNTVRRPECVINNRNAIDQFRTIRIWTRICFIHHGIGALSSRLRALFSYKDGEKRTSIDRASIGFDL
ncbi:hypothetical protein IEQ34_019167 [Dendrobium chrysotoxum]|uniref:Uncharacterized protein n=1 Tax=Dendrobium chrysotoxum TaxID=161865 RepID=A0AAV7G7T5_DENCH|nr:hypothetical protein IEQ34_019167 [Dendrobium chrysotoxum]